MKLSHSPQELRTKSYQIRRHILKMVNQAGTGHMAGPLGMVEVFVVLYLEILKHQPSNPSWPSRDRLLVSNGHICPVWYATLAEAGYFPVTELATYRHLGSRLQGHPLMGSPPGVENTSASLGQNLSVAAGLALSFKLDQKNNRVFCVMSDGEHQEGQTWEAYMFAAANKLNNLTVLIDRNHIQISGFTEEVMPVEPLRKKIEAFGWRVIDVDGHDIHEVIDACQMANSTTDRPTAIICRTTPGKGVSFMENLPEWHGKAPSDQELALALKELEAEQ